MPRIDPLQLLNCLKVLLSPTGGINSSKEVSRLASLMRKFSKKLVSKCIYIQILKASRVELLDKFLNTGGWELIYCWLVDGYSNENWPLIKELLDLLEICPTTADMKDCSDLFKSWALSSDTNVPEDIQKQALLIEKKWVTGMVATVDANANRKSEEKAGGTSAVDNETSDKEDSNSPDSNDTAGQGNDIYKVDKVYMKGGKQVIKLRKKPALETGGKAAAKKRGRPKKVAQGDALIKRKRRKIKDVVEEEDASDEEDYALKLRRRNSKVKSKKCIESSDDSDDDGDDQKTVAPSTDKENEDGKSTIADNAQSTAVSFKVETKGTPKPSVAKSLDKEAINDMITENENNVKANENDKKSEASKKVKSESEKTSKAGDKKASSDKEKKQKPSSKSDHKKDNEQAKERKKEHEQGKERKKEHKKEHEEHGKDHKKDHHDHKKDRDHKKVQEKEKHHESKKENDRKKEELSEQKKKERKEQFAKIKKLHERDNQKWNMPKKPSALSDKDRETLEKLRKLQHSGSGSSLGKIPKKQMDAKLSPPTYSSVLDKNKPSNSGEKKRTIKAPRDKFRDTGLLDEIHTNSSKNAKKTEPKPEVKPPMKPFGSTTFPQKRSPPQDKDYTEKKLKLGLYGDTIMPYANTTNNATSPPINSSPGDKSLKSKAHSLQESSGFMAALDAAEAENRRTKTKKKRTNSNEKKEEALTPTQIKPTFSFYKDRLEEDAEEKPSEDKQIKKEDEVKKPEVKSEEDVEMADAEDSKEKPEVKEEDDGLEVLVMPKEDGDSDTSQNHEAEENQEASTRQPNSALQGVLVLHRVKKVKKRVTWVEDAELKQIHYFELDETERVNVNKMKTFGDMSMQEKQNERLIFMKARKTVRDDQMEEAIMWYFPARIEGLKEDVQRGSRSEEKNIQYAREKVVPPVHFPPYFHPDTPTEPDHEMVRLQDIKIIPADDLTNPNTVNDFRGTPWPEPKIYIPPLPVEPYKSQFRGSIASNDSGGQWRCHDGSTFQGVVDNNVSPQNSMIPQQSGILGPAPPGFGPPGGGPPPPPPPQNMPPGFSPGGMGMPQMNPGMDMRGGPFHMSGGMQPFQRGRGGPHHRGGGNRNDKHDRNRRGPPLPQGGNRAVCEHYIRTGDCRYAANCKFWHPPR